jgi:hypothetical protein
MVIIWALGPTDALAYHGGTENNRGSTTFNLISNVNTPEPTQATTPLTTPTTENPPGNGQIPLETDLLTVTYSILGDRIVFVAVAKTNGYIGLGFSTTGLMFPGDVCIGGVTMDGSTYFGDYKTTAYGPPTLDIQQDWILIYGNQIENETTLIFSRLLNTGDIEDDIIIEVLFI